MNLSCDNIEEPSIKPASWTYEVLVGTLKAGNGQSKVVPWPILVEGVVSKRQINRHYFWVCKLYLTDLGIFLFYSHRNMTKSDDDFVIAGLLAQSVNKPSQQVCTKWACAYSGEPCALCSMEEEEEAMGPVLLLCWAAKSAHRNKVSNRTQLWLPPQWGRDGQLTLA